MKYLEMIEEAIANLAERKGSSRQAIWKYVGSHYPQADYKQYLVQMRSKVKSGDLLSNKGRVKINFDKKKKDMKSKKRI